MTFIFLHVISLSRAIHIIPISFCRSLNVDAIIRGGLRRYTDQLGHLWNSLADYYVRSGLFERVSRWNDKYTDIFRSALCSPLKYQCTFMYSIYFLGKRYI